MKKLLFTGLLLTAALTAQAQKYMHVWQGNKATSFVLQGAAVSPEITYRLDGTYIIVNDTPFEIATVDSITFNNNTETSVPYDESLPDSVVAVSYNGNSASVTMGRIAAQYITYEINGANVVLTNVNEANEMGFVLSGSSTNGSFTYNGTYKSTVCLNGLNLTSTSGAAIDIQNGKRIDLILTDGTENTLADAAGGAHKAALYCKGHLEVSGSGNLNVTGNTRHAIATKEYLELKKSTGAITVSKAAGDAIHAGQYFLMKGGKVTLSGMAGDGIQAEVTNDPTEELNGQVLIQGGDINIDVAADDAKGIKSDSLITVSGGTFVINAKGAGSKGISAGTDMVINEDDAATTMTISATGGVYEDPETDDTSRCMGIKVTGNLTISAGTITVKNTGTKSRGIKVDGIYYAKGGTVSANINAAATRK